MSRSKVRSTSLLLGALLASGGIGAAVGAAGTDDERVRAETAVSGSRPVSAATGHGTLADMVEAVGPAVVQIQVQPTGLASSFGGYGGGPAGAQGASGSGFVIDPSGIIVTNNHVVEGGGNVLVKFADGSELRARVLGIDPKTDLAVLKVEAGKPLKAAHWGDSDAARVGDDVFAVGSPFGLGNSVTSGIISARGREIGAGPYDDFLQVDASINSGNSGGPLFDPNGAVLGVNTAILSPTGGNVGIGFAIPSRLAQSVVRQIVAEGEVRRGQLSVLLQPLTPQIAERLGLPTAEGALIADVDPSGSAAEAGLRRGDVVVEFGGEPVEDSRQFARRVAEAKIGSRVDLEVLRGGRRMAAAVEIGQSRSS